MITYTIYLEDGREVGHGTNMFFSIGQTLVYDDGTKFEVIGVITQMHEKSAHMNVLARILVYNGN